jgi:hypothetical protein
VGHGDGDHKHHQHQTQCSSRLEHGWKIIEHSFNNASELIRSCVWRRQIAQTTAIANCQRYIHNVRPIRDPGSWAHCIVLVSGSRFHRSCEPRRGTPQPSSTPDTIFKQGPKVENSLKDDSNFLDCFRAITFLLLTTRENENCQQYINNGRPIRNPGSWDCIVLNDRVSVRSFFWATTTDTTRIIIKTRHNVRTGLGTGQRWLTFLYLFQRWLTFLLFVFEPLQSCVWRRVKTAENENCQQYIHNGRPI